MTNRILQTQDPDLKAIADRLNFLTEGDCSQTEAQQLTRLLLQTLRNSISHEWVTTYLNAIRCGAGEVLENILAQAQFLRLPIDMPATVMDMRIPTFRLGEVVQWIAFDGDEAALMDWGVVVGKFYGYAPQSLRWMWCYLVLLDPDSLAAQWGMIDTAWENELELWGD